MKDVEYLKNESKPSERGSAMTTKQAILNQFECYRVTNYSNVRKYFISFYIRDDGNGINEYVSLDYMTADAATYAIVLDNTLGNFTLTRISPM